MSAPPDRDTIAAVATAGVVLVAMTLSMNAIALPEVRATIRTPVPPWKTMGAACIPPVRRSNPT